MGQRAIKLDLLEQLIAVPDPRQLAEVALQAFRDVVPGDHFSAILFNVKTRKVEDYFLNQGWLAANTPFWQAGFCKEICVSAFLFGFCFLFGEFSGAFSSELKRAGGRALCSIARAPLRSNC